MSREDLNNIQAKLKAAIQNHQMLVTKIKADPQNQVLKKQLHDLQIEITGLSERQKSVVQQLRKELIEKKQLAQAQRPAHVSSVQNEPQNLSTKPPMAHVQRPMPQPPPAHRPMVQATRPILQAHRTLPRAPVPMQQAIRPPAVINRPGAPQKQNRKQLLTARNAKPMISRPSSPLKVPQFMASRPSMLQGTRRSNVIAGVKNDVVPTVPSKRSPDTENCYSFIKTKAIGKKELSAEEREKLEFMASLDLVTQETIKELQNRRSERKRRSTANPQFAYGSYDSDRRRGVENYLANLPSGVKRGRGRPPRFGSSPTSSQASTPDTTESTTPQKNGAKNGEGDVHEDFCAVCHRSGELLMCDTCSLVYHLKCLDPPLVNVPTGMWSCPKCQHLHKETGQWPGTMAVVSSYIAHKTGKEGEIKKLQQQHSALLSEKDGLDSKIKNLSDSISEQVQQKHVLLDQNKNATQNVEQLRGFIKMFQTS